MSDGVSNYVGSGFFINETGPNGEKGYVVTAGHCVLKSDTLKDRMTNIYGVITNFNNTGEDKADEFDIIGIDGAADIAIIRPKNLIVTQSQRSLNWGNSRNLTIGNTSLIIGNPSGIDPQSVTKGIIRDNQHTDISGTQPCENILTDTSITGGNSGSPIIDVNGDVIGILTYGFNPPVDDVNGGTSQYILQPVVKQIITGNGSTSTFTDSDGDYTKKGYLGINWEPVGLPHIVEKKLMGSSYALRGIKITNIVSGGVSTNGNIAVGDWITEIDGNIMGNLEGKIPPGSVTWFKNPGNTVTIKYIPWNEYGGAVGTYPEEQTTVITLSSFPNSEDYPLNSSENV